MLCFYPSCSPYLFLTPDFSVNIIVPGTFFTKISEKNKNCTVKGSSMFQRSVIPQGEVREANIQFGLKQYGQGPFHNLIGVAHI